MVIDLWISVFCICFSDFPMNISIFDAYASNKNNSVYSMYIHMSMSYICFGCII